MNRWLALACFSFTLGDSASLPLPPTPPPPTPKLTIEVLSVEICCLGRLLVYTDNDCHLILGFKIYIQTMVFTLNRDSRKGYRHRQWFSPKSDFTKKLSTQTIPLYSAHAIYSCTLPVITSFLWKFISLLTSNFTLP